MLLPSSLLALAFFVCFLDPVYGVDRSQQPKIEGEVRQLFVGEVLELSDLGGGDVELSRSGLVDLTPKGDFSWLLTALSLALSF